jgi:GntR family transcriptional regulator, phosphonate transport system regulatory protein
MAPEPLWTAIRDALEGDIAARRLTPGDRLPTEAALAQRFGVNRHTVRRALAALADAGVVHSRRGAGVFVTATATDYRIGARTRFRDNLLTAGQTPQKTVLRLDTLPAAPREAEALRLPTGAPVHLWEGVSLADGVPVSLFRSVFDAARFPDLPAALTRHRSVTAALAEMGVADYTRHSTRLSAELADSVRARHLHVRPGAPLLRAVSVNVDPDGRPVEYGRTWFVGERMQVLIESS